MTLQLTWYAPDGTPTVFSATATDYVLLKKYQGFSFTPAVHRTTRFPYQNGATIQNTDGDPREISFEVMVKASTLGEMETLIENLSDQFNPLGEEGILVYEKANGDVRRIYCKSNMPSIDMGVRNATSQKVLIKLIAYDPFWYSDTTNIAYVAPPGTNMFPFPTVTSWPWEFGAISPSPTVINAGTMDAACTFVFTGPIQNPSLNNLTTGKTFSITKDMAAGDTFTVTTDIGEQSAYYTPSGGAVANGMQWVDITAEFWQLVPGNNMITLTAVSATSPAGCSVEWSDRYVGV